MKPFKVTQRDDELPTIKGNGFDGLIIGNSREEAEAFIEFVNALNDGLECFSDDEIIEEMDGRGYDCGKQKPIIVDIYDLYELKRTGKTAEFDTAFADYCWQEIGRII